MAGMMSRAHGELEAEVMRILWERGGVMRAREIQAAFSRPYPAYSTLMTSLGRLEAKGRVYRVGDSPRKVSFGATESAEEHSTSLMLSALRDSPDRKAALLLFAGTLDRTDIELLQKALHSRVHRKSG